jgi:endonuclease/exonuclease/phosphatase (EEP) superfamily protein YafD
LQELNPEIAAAIERELAGEYPYQWLLPEPGVTGGGLISRFPFERLANAPLDRVQWVSTPMVVRLQLPDGVVTLVRFHAFANPSTWQAREEQAALLADFARVYDGPLIVIGDLNATDQNDAYAIIAAELGDAWREAGSGFGHTFPGADTRVSPGSSRPSLDGFAVPQWLVRIDYIFHSAELITLDARLGQFDGMSDHRPVVATLAFR